MMMALNGLTLGNYRLQPALSRHDNGFAIGIFVFWGAIANVLPNKRQWAYAALGPANRVVQSDAQSWRRKDIFWLASGFGISLFRQFPNLPWILQFMTILSGRWFVLHAIVESHLTAIRCGIRLNTNSN